MFGANSGTQQTDSTSGNLFATPQQQQIAFGGQQQQSSPFGQQQQAGLTSGFGSSAFAQQPPQQQQQQAGLTGFGSSAFAQQQQQQSPFVQQQQQPSQLFGSARRGNRPQIASVGTDGSPNIKWVAASNGHIPDGAVVGGWATSTKEPYYIARAKCPSDNSLCPGVVLKSTKVCSFVSNNSYGFGMGQYTKADTNPNYEILVTSDDTDIVWIYLNELQYQNHTNRLPSNLLKVGFDNQGHSTYMARGSSWISGDIVPGVFKGNNVVLVEKDKVIPSGPLFGFEVLCCSASSDASSSDRRVNNSYLYDIKYDLDAQNVDWTDKVLGKSVLLNKSSLKQNLTPSFNVVYNKSFNWELSKSSSDSKKVEIKGEVPYIFGSNEEDYCVHLLDGPSLALTLRKDSYSPGTFDGGTINLYGGHFSRFVGGGGGGGLGGGLFGAPNPSPLLGLPFIKGIFTPSTLIVNDISQSLDYKKHDICSNNSFDVPPRSKLTVEQQGLQVSLSIPFKATLKTVYHNDSVEDEEVTGMYKYSSITTSFPAVVGEELAFIP